MDQRDVIQRLDQPQPRDAAQNLVDRPADVRIQMNRKHELHAGGSKFQRQVANRATELPEGSAETLTPVRGNQHQPAGRLEARECARRPVEGTRGNIEQGIDHGVAGNEYVGLTEALAPQRLRRRLRRRKQEVCGQIGDASMHLFRKWLLTIAGPQAGFDVGEPHPVVEGDHARDEHGGRITLREHPVRLRGADDAIEPREQPRREAWEALIGLHDIEIKVRAQIKHREHALQHLPVLSGRAEHRPHVGRMAGQLFQHRSHLDCFGPRADDREDGHQRAAPNARARIFDHSSRGSRHSHSRARRRLRRASPAAPAISYQRSAWR